MLRVLSPGGSRSNEVKKAPSTRLFPFLAMQDRTIRPVERFRAVVRTVILLHRMQQDLSQWYLQQAVTPDSEVSATGEGIAQVGGHAKTFLKLDSGRVAKIADARELSIYPILTKEFPREFLPGFFGTIRDSQDCVRLVLEDLTLTYKQPCIMDLKMGTRTFETDAGMLKKLKLGLVDAVSSSAAIGARLVGMNVWQPLSQQYRGVSKADGVRMTDPVGWFETFADNGLNPRYDVLPFFLERVSLLLQHFQVEQRWEFLGSSLLFVYDGAASENTKCTLRMIDFAHTRRLKQPAPDEGYIVGLRNLEQALKSLVEKAKKLTLPPFRSVGAVLSSEEVVKWSVGVADGFDVGEIVGIKRSNGSVTYGRVHSVDKRAVTVIVDRDNQKQVPWSAVSQYLAHVGGEAKSVVISILSLKSAMGFTPAGWTVTDLQPGGRYSQCDDADNYRRVFSFADGGLPLLSVAAASPSDKAGLRQYDVIQQVDGVDVRRLPLATIMAILRSASQKSDTVGLLVLRSSSPSVL